MLVYGAEVDDEVDAVAELVVDAEAGMGGATRSATQWPCEPVTNLPSSFFSFKLGTRRLGMTPVA